MNVYVDLDGLTVNDVMIPNVAVTVKPFVPAIDANNKRKVRERSSFIPLPAVFLPPPPPPPTHSDRAAVRNEKKQEGVRNRRGKIAFPLTLIYFACTQVLTNMT